MRQALLVGACLVVWWVVGVPLLPVVLAIAVPVFAALSFIFDKYNHKVVVSPAERSRSAVLVTGTSSGIGRAAVARLAASGFHVFASVRKDKDAAALQKLADELGCRDRITPVMMEVTDEQSVADAEQVVHKCLDEQGLKLMAIINNAGIAGRAPVELVSPKNVQHMINVNVMGVLHICQAFLPHLRAAGGGATIVNISSVLGGFVVPYRSVYSASKAAMEALSDGLRVELRSWGINVVVVQPGYVQTDISLNSFAADLELAKCPKERAVLYPYFGQWLKKKAAAAGRSQHIDQGIPPAEVAHLLEKIITVRRPHARYMVGREAWVVRLCRVLPTFILDWVLFTYLAQSSS